jgi:hypothetical protein
VNWSAPVPHKIGRCEELRNRVAAQPLKQNSPLETGAWCPLVSLTVHRGAGRVRFRCQAHRRFVPMPVHLNANARSILLTGTMSSKLRAGAIKTRSARAARAAQRVPRLAR